MKRIHLQFLLLPLLLLFACGTSENKINNPEPEASAPLAVNTNAPSADLVSQSDAIPVSDFNGLEHLLHQNNDTTYVINFWATWCKPCVAELPYFEQLTQNYRDEKLKVILISLDFVKQIEAKLIPFIKEHQLQSEVWVLNDPDANAWIDKVNPQWSGAIPATIIYKQDTREFREQSFETYEELNTIVKPFLKKEK